MPGCSLSQGEIEKVVDFHGHWCPGLAIGLRAGEYITRHLGRAEDEEIVAVVESDMCAVDAIQVLTGCTFGKGNLIYRDLGKIAFSFYPRGEGREVRLVFDRRFIIGGDDAFLEMNGRWLKGQLNAEEEGRLKRMRRDRAEGIMQAPLEEVFAVKKPLEPAPRKARILDTLECAQCGEGVMESRTRWLEGRTLCITCFEALGGSR